MYKPVLIIIPTHNELHNVNRLVNYKPDYCDIVIIDDSFDGTDILAKSLGINVVKSPPTRYPYIQLKYLYGLMYAINNGYNLAVTIDAGENFDIDWTNLLFNAIGESDADVIIGSREFKGYGIRRLMSNIATNAATRGSGYKINDATSGFRLYKVSSIRDIVLNERWASKTPHAFQVEMLLKCMRRCLVIKEVAILYRKPKSSTAKLTTIIDWLLMLVKTKG